MRYIQPPVQVLPPVTAINDNTTPSPWAQGHKARREGKSLLDNPYTLANMELISHAAWSHGWLEAEEELSGHYMGSQ